MERSTGNYIHWRKGVFNRDGFICQCCMKRSTKGNALCLNAHHIFNWKDNPDLRYDINNGITLCIDCHKKFHKLYGKENNSKFQFDDFLNKYGKKVC